MPPHATRICNDAAKVRDTNGKITIMATNIDAKEI
jgi:hypothetical protein